MVNKIDRISELLKTAVKEKYLKESDIDLILTHVVMLLGRKERSDKSE